MTRYFRWQLLLILIGAVLVGIFLTYLALNYTIVLRPGRGGTYVEGIAGFPRYLNPLLSGYNEGGRDICTLIFSGLTRLNEHGEVETDLARSWEVTLDGLMYTFRLRSNVYWHDGVPLTADDVVFTVSLLQDPAFPGPPELADLWRVIKVEKVDRYTVRFILPGPYAYAPFLDYTTFGILPAHLLGGTRAADLPEAPFNLRPVGSGPFRLADINIENGVITSLVLERFPYFYGTVPHLDRIQFRFYPSSQAVLDAYEAGEVDGIGAIPIADLPRARALTTLNLYSAPLAEYGIVLLNLARADLPFFQEREVRQAMLYALDRQRIIDGVLDGQALVAHSPLIPGTWAYKADVPRYEYDPARARALLDEAGWVLSGHGDRIRRKGDRSLAFTLLTSDEPTRVAVAQMLAEQWAAVGITVTVTTVSPAEVFAALEARSFEAVLIHLSLPGDPDLYPFWHETQVEGGQNYAGFKHRRISEIIEQARVTLAREWRLQLYDEFQSVFAREVPALLLYVPVYTYGVDRSIHNVQIGPLLSPSERFRTVARWWIVPRRVFVRASEARAPLTMQVFDVK